MKTKTEDINGLPKCYRSGQMVYFRLDGRWEGEGILESGKWEGNKYILDIRLTSPCKEHAKDTIIRVDNEEVI